MSIQSYKFNPAKWLRHDFHVHELISGGKPCFDMNLRRCDWYVTLCQDLEHGTELGCICTCWLLLSVSDCPVFHMKLLLQDSMFDCVQHSLKAVHDGAG